MISLYFSIRHFDVVTSSSSVQLQKLTFFAGVNLLIGTEHGLMLLDRSGQGKVYQLISRRRFQQMEVLEGQNILVTISGKKNRVRVYYLSWLKSKILRTDGVSDVSIKSNLFYTLVVLIIPVGFLMTFNHVNLNLNDKASHSHPLRYNFFWIR